ncbi:minichromosome maintenance complex protein, putative [Babesia ovata]|uniref:Minichromosome maintenance complex protein, putative n=1 Tax=Babesia ovata TaxID=189622 RepID=A0A2H6KAY2_9APIC|nr:minichromosome maintenance complex protein, putative [Babesia ovata]GBE60148.1 minichromosome maintenance complex protein, putative [Babesia ovata]
MIEHEDRYQGACNLPDRRDEGGVEAAIQLKANHDEDLPNAGGEGEKRQVHPYLRVLQQYPERSRALEYEHRSGGQRKPEEVEGEKQHEGVEVLGGKHLVLEWPRDTVTEQREEAHEHAEKRVFSIHPALWLEVVEAEDTKRDHKDGNVVVHRIPPTKNDKPSNKNGYHFCTLNDDLGGNPNIFD